MEINLAWNRNVFDNQTVYLRLNYVLMVNWIVWNGAVFLHLTECKQNLYLY